MPGPEVKNSRQRAWALRNQEWLNEYKAQQGCAVCGERDPVVLQFDHVEPKMKLAYRFNQHRGGFGIAWNLLGVEKRAAELAKCQVLCANCHCRKTHEERREYQGAW